MVLYRSAHGYGRGSSKGRLIMGLVIAAFTLFSYYGSREVNPVTGETQAVAMSKTQEIALGLQAAPEMAAQFGGLDPDMQAQSRIDDIGQRLVKHSAASSTDWKFEFHLLGDKQTVNAFALPGGQIFMTRALYDLLESEGQIAGVLGHEIGHVVGRHGAEQLAKQQLTQGLTGAAVVASGDYRTAQLAQVVGSLIHMRYGRGDELESDRLGVRFLAEAGYDPRSMIRVMHILEKASGPNRQPEFFSTHPNPGNRITVIEHAIREQFPNGLPVGLRS